MEIKSLSATAIKSYLECPARYLAETSARVRVDSPPAAFGTAIHTTLEWYHKMLDDPASGTPDVVDIWTTVCNKFLGPNSSYYEQGTDILARYLESSYSRPAEVVSYEQKEPMTIVAEKGTEVTVNYICDRVDRDAGGLIEIIDYKTAWGQETPDSMRQMIQPILYACAMRRKYEITTGVRVTFLMLRHDPIDVSVVFSQADMDRFERSLSDVAQRILDDTDARERLSAGCKWCIRKGVCGTLAKAETLGWAPSMPLAELADVRTQAENAISANESLINEIDEVMLRHLREEDVPESAAGEYVIYATRSKRGKYDPVTIYSMLGEDALRFMTVGKTILDKEAKKKGPGVIPVDVRPLILDSVNTTYGEPSIKVKKNTAEEVL